MKSIKVYVNEHLHEYIEWFKTTKEESKIPMIGQDYPAGDIDKAIHYYEVAVKEGNTNGLTSIGLLYQYGTGVEQSYESVVE